MYSALLMAGARATVPALESVPVAGASQNAPQGTRKGM